MGRKLQYHHSVIAAPRNTPHAPKASKWQRIIQLKAVFPPFLLRTVKSTGVRIDGTNGREFTCQCRRQRNSGWTPASKRSPRVGNGNQLHYSCMVNSMDREAWWATVHGGAKSWTCIYVQHLIYIKCNIYNAYSFFRKSIKILIILEFH